MSVENVCITSQILALEFKRQNGINSMIVARKSSKGRLLSFHPGSQSGTDCIDSLAPALYYDEQCLVVFLSVRHATSIVMPRWGDSMRVSRWVEL
jgi:hypothetical protein